MNKILIIITLICSNLYSKNICYIAIDSKDCSNCQISYHFISKIDLRLNPIIILSNADSSSAKYLVEEYLKIKNIPYKVDQNKFKSLLKDEFSLQIQLCDDTQIVFQFPVKELSMRINELNSYATNSKDEFKNRFLKDLSNEIKTKYFLDTRHFIIDEELALYSNMTRWLVFANIKSNSIKSIRFTDSLLFSFTYSKSKLESLKFKREYYQTILEGTPESNIISFCYYLDKIYLVYNVLDYDSMKSKEEIYKSNFQTELYYKHFLIEIIQQSNGNLVTNRKIDVSNDYINFRIGFCITNNTPSLIIKTNIKESDSFFYISLNNLWNKYSYTQKQSKKMSKYLTENLFYNEFTYNYDQYIIINNNTGKFLKLFPGDMITTRLLTGGSLYFDSSFVYFNSLIRERNEHYIYRLNIKTAKAEVLKTYKEENSYDFYPIFYFEKFSNTLYVIDINDYKEFYIVDSFFLK